MQLKHCLLALFALTFLATQSNAQPQEKVPAEKVQIWQHAFSTPVSRPLKNIVDIIGTKDDKFIYTASYDGALGVFERDQKTGELTLESILNDELYGLASLSLNEDETLLAGACFRELNLFRRDTKTGQVTLLDKLKNGDDVKNNLSHVVSSMMSSDGRFLYVPNDGGALGVYSIIDERLSLLQAHDGIDNCLRGAHLMATDSTDKMFFVACENSGVIAVFDRDPDAGHVRFLSFFKDGDDDGNGDDAKIAELAGAHSVAVRPDDKFVYVLGGRNRGTTAINVFGLEKETGKLNLVQVWVPKNKPFDAGNHIAITPDGKYLIASGAESKTLACFSIDEERGEIQFKEFLRVDDTQEIGMISGLHFCDDGKFLYAGDEVNGRIYCFRKSEE